jgi:hypothetical protein
MEILQGNSLCSYLKQTKFHFFLLQNQRTGGQNRSYLGMGGWSWWEKGGYGESV